MALQGENRGHVFDARLMIQLLGLIMSAGTAVVVVVLFIAGVRGDVATFTQVAAEKFRITDATLARLERKDESLDQQIDDLQESLRKR